MYVIKFYDSRVWGKNGIMVETKKYVCDSLHVIRIVSNLSIALLRRCHLQMRMLLQRCFISSYRFVLDLR